MTGQLFVFTENVMSACIVVKLMLTLSKVMAELKSVCCIHTTMNSENNEIRTVRQIWLEVYVLVFSLKAKLCLHVVKHALNNYINVAMM